MPCSSLGGGGWRGQYFEQSSPWRISNVACATAKAMLQTNTLRNLLGFLRFVCFLIDDHKKNGSILFFIPLFTATFCSICFLCTLQVQFPSQLLFFPFFFSQSVFHNVSLSSPSLPPLPLPPSFPPSFYLPFRPIPVHFLNLLRHLQQHGVFLPPEGVQLGGEGPLVPDEEHHLLLQGVTLLAHVVARLMQPGPLLGAFIPSFMHYFH